MTQEYKRKYFKEFKQSLWEHIGVWRIHNGEIPKGFHIHHKDENKHNNDISNLECLSKKEHRAKHTKELRERVFYCKVCKKEFRSGSYLMPVFCGRPCRQKDYVINHRDTVNSYKRKWRASKKTRTY